MKFCLECGAMEEEEFYEVRSKYLKDYEFNKVLVPFFIYFQFATFSS